MTPLLTPEEVAEKTKLCVATIQRACRRGELDASRPAGRWRITEKAVTQWLENSKPRPPESRATSPAPGRVRRPLTFGRTTGHTGGN